METDRGTEDWDLNVDVMCGRGDEQTVGVDNKNSESYNFRVGI